MYNILFLFVTTFYFLIFATLLSQVGPFIMYLKKQLKADELKIVSNYQENVWIKLKLKGSDELLVGCIYKSPNSDKENLSLLNKMIIEASQMSTAYNIKAICSLLISSF
jgi:hypothetical protein